MDKRYQVFVSSTFTDLKDERQGVLKAILELDHMPAGMELFPATDASAWQLITDVIDASDYYVLIVGGRYGSLDETGIGYTEKEYDHAVATKKPVVPLLHEKPDNLPRDKTETDASAWKRLTAFREKVEKRHTCVYWKNAEDLKSKVIVGLTAIIKRQPMVGWVRADQVPTGATLVEVLTLRNRVAELEAVSTARDTVPPPGTEGLAQGTDRVDLSVTFTARPRNSRYPHDQDVRYRGSLNPTWNQIFAAVAPTMTNEATDAVLRSALKAFITQEARRVYQEKKPFKDKSLVDFSHASSEVDTCIIQLRALRLIKINDKKRSVTDRGTYWTLTPYGDVLMVQLRAVHREPIEDDVQPGEVEEEEEEEEEDDEAKGEG
ncbi:DUF4062 domain-containing protein [Hydrogenophaga borbori]|uniref:DUF4062 domain-containing protein n=1 Tax=Hydrogenophaga borbori TaxID=2294117 RepID=A0A372EGC2_9BURK|nr:DUF4062 domain-containing protein [Hydrogenophaga borbori]RFP77413.1 DUF4062 domain-containing protein [Hydrogenophaga borbori]